MGNRIEFKQIPQEGYDINSEILFSWDILLLCNYNCKLCYAKQVKLESSFQTLETINRILEDLKKVEKTFTVLIIGGEPSLHPRLEYILDSLKNIKNCYRVVVFTNGEKHIKREIARKADYINISYYPEQTTIEKFKKSIDYYREITKTRVSFALTGENEDQKVQILDYCRSLNIACYPHFFNNGKRYYRLKDTRFFSLYKDKLPKELWFSDTGALDEIQAFTPERYEFRGWKCKLNMFEISAKYRGFIQFCMNRVFTPEQINSSDFWTTCEVDECICAGRGSCEKFRDLP